MGTADRWRRMPRAGGLALVRRRAAMLTDRALASPWKRLGPPSLGVPLGGDPRFALITVNFSTTHYLKLLLLTLSEQADLGLIHRLVIVDNCSHDGGAELVGRLSRAVPRLTAVHRRHGLGHGPGMRAGVRSLDRLEAGADRPTNLLLFCDTDVVFRSREVLRVLAGAALAHDASLMGEVRSGANPRPDIQASFFVVRRDAYARRDIAPLVHDGAPAYRLQQSIADAGLTVANVPTNHGGLVLHRGRAGVEAAAMFHPRHHYAAVRSSQPHYMGVPGGAAIWEEIEARHASLLEASAEDELIDVLAERFRRFGTSVVTD